MHIDLTDTRSSAVLTALTDARHRSGTAALGMVLTVVVDVDEVNHHDAVRAATAAAREHPCRIVTVIKRTSSAPARLDAEIRVGDDGSLAEVIMLRLYGELRKQADSVVLPLLLPDAPVLVWWPTQGPATPADDPLGRLGKRRVTDSAASSKPLAALRARSRDYAPGDTDFAWTRLTPWRTLLAAALDQPFDPIVAGEVGAARNNPSAELLATWLECQLGVPVERHLTRGPGITSARLLTRRGEIAIGRPDGRLATLQRTGQPDRAVALPRRSADELLAEEMRRLDPDDIYRETILRVFGAAPPEGVTADAAAARRPGRPARRQPLRTASADATDEVVGARPRASTTARALEARAAARPDAATTPGEPGKTASPAKHDEPAKTGELAKTASPAKAAAKRAAPQAPAKRAAPQTPAKRAVKKTAAKKGAKAR